MGCGVCNGLLRPAIQHIIDVSDWQNIDIRGICSVAFAKLFPAAAAAGVRSGGDADTHRTQECCLCSHSFSRWGDLYQPSMCMMDVWVFICRQQWMSNQNVEEFGIKEGTS